MLTLDEEQIATRVAASDYVQRIRAQIAKAESELEQAHQALLPMPFHVRADLLAQQIGALEALRQSGEMVEGQARHWAINVAAPAATRRQRTGRARSCSAAKPAATVKTQT